MSINGSLSAESDGCSKVPLPENDFRLPNSCIFGFPSGPIVMEYPYTIGPTSLTFPPSGVSYSLIRSFGTLFSIFLNCSENILSVSLLMSSNSLNISSKFQPPKPLPSRLLRPPLPPKKFLKKLYGSISFGKLI
jgi:hypothetical protein